MRTKKTNVVYTEQPEEDEPETDVKPVAKRAKKVAPAKKGRPKKAEENGAGDGEMKKKETGSRKRKAVPKEEEEEEDEEEASEETAAAVEAE